MIPRLLPNLNTILSADRGGHVELCDLIAKIIRPVTFTQALTLASEDVLVQGLESTQPAAVLLILTIIEKAAQTPADTAILSIKKTLVEKFIVTWLTHPKVEVGAKATDVLLQLLETDCDDRSIDTRMAQVAVRKDMALGQGLLWRRIFQDADIYEAIYRLCSKGHNVELDEKQLSLAQARLLRILPRLAVLDLAAVSRSDFPAIEVKYGSSNGERGLLYFACVSMVDKHDMLMHVTLADFLVDLVKSLSLLEIPRVKMVYLAKIIRDALNGDKVLANALETMATADDAEPELLELLDNLRTIKL